MTDTHYGHTPRLIGFADLPSRLKRAGYTPEVSYHQTYHAASRGGLGSIQTRTKRRFLPAHRLDDLAQRLGLKRATVTRFERGEVQHVTIEQEAAEAGLQALKAAGLPILPETRQAVLDRLHSAAVAGLTDSGTDYWPTAFAEIVGQVSNAITDTVASVKARQAQGFL